MSDNNTPFQGHPFYVALSIFNAAMRTPLNLAAAFWRPWFTDDENKKMQTAQDVESQEVEISWKSLCRRPRINSPQTRN